MPLNQPPNPVRSCKTILLDQAIQRFSLVASGIAHEGIEELNIKLLHRLWIQVPFPVTKFLIGKKNQKPRLTFANGHDILIGQRPGDVCSCIMSCRWGLEYADSIPYKEERPPQKVVSWV